MKVKQNVNKEYVAYTEINGELRSVGVFWTINEAREYCRKNYNDYNFEGVMENES